MRSDHERPTSAAGAPPEAISNQRGFTLLETVIALVVMMIVFMGVLSLFAYSINYNSGANDRAIATAIAQEQLEKLRNVKNDSTNLPVGTTGVTTGLAALPDVVRGGRTYSIVRTISSSNGLKTISITVTPRGAGPLWANTSITVMTQRALLSTGAYMLP